MRRVTSHPAFGSLLLFAGVAVAGFVAMGLGWRVAARSLNVSDQVPAIVSGGVGGLLLVVIGVGLFITQTSRARAAQERADADGLLDTVSEVIQALRAQRGTR